MNRDNIDEAPVFGKHCPVTYKHLLRGSAADGWGKVQGKDSIVDDVPLKVFFFFVARDERHTISVKCPIKLKTIFNRIFNWKMVWRSSLEIQCSNNENQFQWQINHNAIFTEHKRQFMNFSDSFCPLCKYEMEDVRHILLFCPVFREVIELIINK